MTAKYNLFKKMIMSNDKHIHITTNKKIAINCIGMNCRICNFYEECKNIFYGKLPILSEHNTKKLIRNYPEYFI